MKVVAITREKRFSPNSTEKDQAIMNAVITRLTARGEEVLVINEQTMNGLPQGDCYITMGRDSHTLALLDEKEKRGIRVINSSHSIRNCNRDVLSHLMQQNGILTPPEQGNDGYWIKRADSSAQSENDVVYAPDEHERDISIDKFRQRGIDKIVTSAHVKGDLVKFYGVMKTSFFRYYYPTEDKETKFGHESINGRAHFYTFDTNRLQSIANKLSEITGVEIYGGDCIISPQGEIYIIDFNDWPSFSRCREEAAEAIASLI
ncbi:hypothetical protein [Bacteroides heparinolyticus]|uniref:hypothetical protein n=1 Tax=Prevotella heparinolytica TaxID=28113 RepID=UPI0035A10C78